MWIKLSLAAAIEVSKIGKLRLGWTIARAELLNAKLLQCYRCWSFGHVQARCTSQTDRRDLCFRCGAEGHRAAECGNQLRCVLCDSVGKDAVHRIGAVNCGSVPVGSGGLNRRQTNVNVNKKAVGSKVLQRNLNRNRRAFDLLMQHTAEWRVDLCIIAEPPRLQDGNTLARSVEGLAAIWWNPRFVSCPVRVRGRGNGYVAVDVGKVSIVGCYLPPNKTIAQLSDRLDNISDYARRVSSELIVGGDFNAASPLWRSRLVNTRGDHVEVWAAGLDLRIVNDGNVPTCVRPQVILGGEAATGPGPATRGWNWSKMDADQFNASLIWSRAINNMRMESTPAEDWAKWIEWALVDACDSSTPRLGHQQVRIEIAYRLAKKRLRLAIAAAKSRAWEELVGMVEEDPWGLPYKLILGRLCSASCATAESLEPAVLETVLTDLFPGSEETDPGSIWPDGLSEQCEVTVEETASLLREGTGNAAPGLDGIPLKIIRQVPTEILDKIAACFTVCMRIGTFPRAWKQARLVLIPKGEMTSENSVLKLRPICLLRDVAKLFERFRRVAKAAFNSGGVALAISLDIRNAFNSVPWATIRRTMIRKNFPPYIRHMVDSYLYERSIEITTRNGVSRTEYGCQLLCYADDTLILASADTVNTATRRVNFQLARTLLGIKWVGVEVATTKTEVVLLTRLRGGLKDLPYIRVGNDQETNRDRLTRVIGLDPYTSGIPDETNAVRFEVLATPLPADDPGPSLTDDENSVGTDRPQGATFGIGNAVRVERSRDPVHANEGDSNLTRGVNRGRAMGAMDPAQQLRPILTLGFVVSAILRSRESWLAVANFAERIYYALQ
ncbi:uncharacterized protein [Anoplolepis gracilipes]|uniref:uncharacterized protein n=1 Tax=Anoplolepis gracilipes TaxID=354296 RepID=UPI003B9DE3EA